MHFTQVGSSYRVSRVTGPAHNLLGLQVEEAGSTVKAVAVDLATEEPHHRERLSAAEVLQCALEGIDQANAALGRAYRAKIVEFDSTDTLPARIYTPLARALIERLARGEPFDSGS